VGKQADLVVFDANKIKDMASFENPELPAEGIHHVLVNGQFVMHNGQQTINRPGQFLSK
jgi:N-acyl-D-amino-acid deacylase